MPFVSPLNLDPECPQRRDGRHHVVSLEQPEYPRLAAGQGAQDQRPMRQRFVARDRETAFQPLGWIGREFQAATRAPSLAISLATSIAWSWFSRGSQALR